MDKRKPSDPSSNPLPKQPKQLTSSETDTSWRHAPEEKLIEGEVKPVHIPKQVEQFSYALLPLVGYGLLGFSLFALIDALVPLQLTNPNWEFRTLSRLVDMSPAILIGLLFVFFRREGYIRRSEMLVLRSLSWATLVIGVFYFLLIPLGLINSARINQRTESEIAYKLVRQNEQINKAKSQAEAATDDQLEKFIEFSRTKNPNQQIIDPQRIRAQWQKEIAKAKENAEQNAAAERSAKTTELIKDAAKANIGAALAGTLFILFWRMTLWARVTE